MDNFTNQDNNMQNTAGGNTYSYDYMNNAANTNGDYSQPQNVAQDYTQPGTYTGATAAWQAQKQAQRQPHPLKKYSHFPKRQMPLQSVFF